jgi:hypothetical protein
MLSSLAAMVSSVTAILETKISVPWCDDLVYVA